MPSDRKARFSKVWSFLPFTWKKGVYTALDGGVFRGELDAIPNGKHRPLSVFIAPKEVGDIIERLLWEARHGT